MQVHLGPRRLPTDADAGALAAGTVTMGCSSHFFITPTLRPSRPPALGAAAADPTVLLGDRCNALQGQSCAHLGCAEPVVRRAPPSAGAASTPCNTVGRQATEPQGELGVGQSRRLAGSNELPTYPTAMFPLEQLGQHPVGRRGGITPPAGPLTEGRGQQLGAGGS